MERILAVFAHPDDEASCVCTMANHGDAGDAVRL
jgi:LmbE family N-acetylglucosaminyl deacetylase